MEFDSARAGGFEPLRLLPKGKKVVLACLFKNSFFGTKDELKKKSMKPQNTSRSRTCPVAAVRLASTHHGNKLTQDEQWRKLERVVANRQEVWK